MAQEVYSGNGTLEPPPFLPLRSQRPLRARPKAKLASPRVADESTLDPRAPPFIPPRRSSSLTKTAASRPTTVKGSHYNDVVLHLPQRPQSCDSQARAARRYSAVPAIQVDPPTDENSAISSRTGVPALRDADTPISGGKNEPSPDKTANRPKLKAPQELQEPASGLVRSLPRRVVSQPSKLRVARRTSEESEEADAVPTDPGSIAQAPSHPYQLGKYGVHASAGAILIAHGRNLSVRELQRRQVPITSTPTPGQNDIWHLPTLPASAPTTGRSSPIPRALPDGPPKRSFVRLSSLDNLLTYRDERQEWKRVSSMLTRSGNSSLMRLSISDRAEVSTTEDVAPPVAFNASGPASEDPPQVESVEAPVVRFRNFGSEVGFCVTIAMTQLLAEYLISGFAAELANASKDTLAVGQDAMSVFWPASLLSLILGGTLLVFARLSDMYGGYLIFLGGVVWLAIWTMIPGFCKSLLMLDVSRAMQGLAIAAYTPSTYTIVGSIYPEGRRRNFILGLYGACAPLGFYVGFLVAAALPKAEASWYFFIASILSCITVVSAYVTVPADRANRRSLGLRMDWVGTVLITSGLILVAYAVASGPYASKTINAGFKTTPVIATLVSGVVCLVTAVYWEGWWATCPLLPFDFFRPKGVKPLAVACLFFYGCFGVWLYQSTTYFKQVQGIELALWYSPTAIGGIIFAIAGGLLLHLVPITLILLFSGLAWIAAPLVLALHTPPVNYWAVALPSTLCATIGVDLTFTVSTVFLSSVQPLRYQGLAGAVCSILVNVAMSFSLSFGQLAGSAASWAHKGNVFDTSTPAGRAQAEAATEEAVRWIGKGAFFYATASASIGFIICAVFVRISRSVVSEHPAKATCKTTSTVTTVDGEQQVSPPSTSYSDQPMLREEEC